MYFNGRPGPPTLYFCTKYGNVNTQVCQTKVNLCHKRYGINYVVLSDPADIHCESSHV